MGTNFQGLLFNKFLDGKVLCGLLHEPCSVVRDDLFPIASKAEVFDFGLLHLDEMETAEDLVSQESPESCVKVAHNTRHYVIPSLTKDESEWWDMGLIPMPANTCWFEFRWKLFDSPSSVRSALLIDFPNPTDMRVTRIDENRADGVWCRKATESDYACPTKISDSRDYMLDSADKEALTTLIRKVTIPRAFALFVSGYKLSKYFALMINSRTTQVERAPAVPPKLVAARKKERRSAIPQHTIVSIVPHKWTGTNHAPRVAGQGQEHSPHRLHWRRSHLRRYERATAKSVWLDADDRLGYERAAGYYAVIPRHLVGRRELGEISHTYRVQA